MNARRLVLAGVVLGAAALVVLGGLEWNRGRFVRDPERTTASGAARGSTEPAVPGPPDELEAEEEQARRRSLEQLTRREIWQLGVDRFGWHRLGPPEGVSKARLIEHFLQDERLKDWGDYDDPPDE